MLDQTVLQVLSAIRPSRVIAMPIVIAIFLIGVGYQNFLMFHTLVELFAICIAVLMCVVAWQSFPFSRNNFLMFLACGYFWVGAVDMTHTLIYKGMGIYHMAEANPATQLWLAGRYMESVLLFLAPFFFSRAVNRWTVFSIFGVIATIMYVLVMSGNFPDAFIEGQGLTAFKINSEYAIIAVLIASIIHLTKKRSHVNASVFTALIASIVLTIIAEISFTYYIDVFGLSNIIGHVFKFFSFWLIFQAIVRSTLVEPYVALEHRIEDLDQSNKELEMFAHVASHDLKEPLRMVASYTELLAQKYEGRLDEKADKYIRYAVDGAKRMNILIDNLLAYSQIDRKKTYFKSVDCNEIVNEAINDHQLMIAEAQAEIICGELPVVIADRRQLTQLFQNLIDNAIKFRRDVPLQIKIEVIRLGNEWQFCISDNGIGIAPEFYDKIFTIFQRLHDRATYPGTGLGLALCKKIVGEHGGRIWVESALGAGTTFCFTLAIKE